MRRTRTYPKTAAERRRNRRTKAKIGIWAMLSIITLIAITFAPLAL